ncbi:MAG: histidine--tRNA ligase [Oscillospiraceae bacterium]|nr:histidine--tRNA ligase [Oscillospiraceae bacterium]
MKLKAVKGTRDYLPYEAELREYMERTILGYYRANGFQRIMTPALEDIENLDKSDGGDNLNLIFKIMKRGEKLSKAVENKTELADMGLRYDLTLPLSRYYSANRQNLPSPFKCIQIDKAYRAERNQKGRLREFIQCDIDVIGDSSPMCETELITVTAKALTKLDIGGFTVKVNDRRLLNALLLKMGFEEEQLSSVCISFDKLDKIGADVVISELTDKGFSADAINKFSQVLSDNDFTVTKAEQILGDDSVTSSLESIISVCRQLSDGLYKVEFDISLVRGQGYYTGTVFEIKSDKFSGSVAGGGRYDNLIGKFTNESVPACGFSIGFERIFSILSDMQRKAEVKPKLAFIYGENWVDAYNQAEQLREKYDVSLFARPKKMRVFLDKLKNSGFSGFVSDGEMKMF